MNIRIVPGISKTIQLKKHCRIVGRGSQPFKKHENKKNYQNIHGIDVIQSFLKEKGPYKLKKNASIVSV